MLIGHRNGISRIFLVEIALVGSPAEASFDRVLNCTFYPTCCSLESRGGCGEIKFVVRSSLVRRLLLFLPMMTRQMVVVAV